MPRLESLAFFLLIPILGTGPARPDRAPQGTQPIETATFHVDFGAEGPMGFSVEADLPIDGQTLDMSTTRPGGIAELDAGGWPALVQGLSVRDAQGASIEATRVGPEGWKLARACSGRIHLSYAVDYSVLQELQWPAPRESVWVGEVLQLVGRSLFITTPALGPSTVTFELGIWRAVTPWNERPGSPPQFAVDSAQQLTENLVVLMQSAPDVVEAGGFRLLVVPTGPWIAARSEVRRVLEAALPRLVGLIGVDERANYLVSLLPLAETGGESFRNSFASTFEEPPSRANSARWANTIAHEIFHQWNGWRLRGADYGSTQWFHEGFTEYAANVSLVAAGLTTPEEFLAKLAEHVQNRERLATSLENTGGRKGPPLYSAGALVAFTWDVQIRHATQGERNLWDFMRALWERTGRGQWPYEWKDQEAALAATADLDWEAFHRAHIAGTEPLPLAETFALAGVRLESTPDGLPQLALDPQSSEAARALWQGVLSGK